SKASLQQTTWLSRRSALRRMFGHGVRLQENGVPACRALRSSLPRGCGAGATAGDAGDRVSAPHIARSLRGKSARIWALLIGSFRTRFPVAAKIALATAGPTYPAHQRPPEPPCS